MLQALAERAGFELRGQPTPPRVLILDLEGAPVREVLGRLLDDVPYEVRFGLEPRAGHQVVEHVRIGEPAAAKAKAPREADASFTTRMSRQLRAVGAVTQKVDPPEDPARLDALSRLEHVDPQVRAEAVSWLDPEGEDLERLRDVSVRDPDPEVRAAAVAMLGDGSSFGAVEGVVAALSDESPVVVVEAIEELVLMDDPTVVPHLRPLVEHPDPEVAEAARDAIDFITF